LPNWKLTVKSPAIDMLFITREEEVVLGVPPKQVLYFYAPWMVFHSKWMTALQAAEEENKGVVFVGIDIEQFDSQRKRFFIESIPTIIALENGKEIGRISNTFSTETFKSILTDICATRPLNME